MSYLDHEGVRLHYELEGREDAPVLVLSNSLGTTLEMWAPQMPALLQHFRVLRHDARGHGRSDVPPGPYSTAQLGADVLALMDHLGIARAHFCGLSMGGMIGMWLGTHHAGRLDRLALCNTAAKIGTPETWNPRIAKVEAEGMASIVDTVLERWFTDRFRARAPEQVAVVRDMLLNTAPAGYSANCAAVRDMDQRADLASIRVPTLVIAGTHDGSTPAADGRAVADAIPGARYVELDAAHLSNWEQSEQFTQALVAFLTA
ncbi:3-oxoadipate enol-lactonase [Noviherbaspirillum suwonense]|uniref:3-oxoadipate enol-lactonase n=1 Tax=Noviherbaspirillum suwonense TaxID=1224511 RepID=A0ABY1PS76_9BURK|nr:3-oxoadipate enol-lactonase [Noviherbaspirillum suwonense]SMP44673.1 3-oxoadipate enol-lactonase [Noviherbaspirillum suwonense]